MPNLRALKISRKDCTLFAKLSSWEKHGHYHESSDPQNPQNKTCGHTRHLISRVPPWGINKLSPLPAVNVQNVANFPPLKFHYYLKEEYVVKFL